MVSVHAIRPFAPYMWGKPRTENSVGTDIFRFQEVFRSVPPQSWHRGWPLQSPLVRQDEPKDQQEKTVDFLICFNFS